MHLRLMGLFWKLCEWMLEITKYSKKLLNYNKIKLITVGASNARSLRWMISKMRKAEKKIDNSIRTERN